MRIARTTALAVTAAVGAGVAAVAAGRYASDAALRLPPGHRLPTEPKLTVHRAEGGRIVLTRDLASLRPGRYGLAGSDFHAAVGPVLDRTEGEVAADTVVRRLERVFHGTPGTGDRAWLTPQLYSGDPATALGLSYAGVEIPGELGVLPGWMVPGDRRTWVVAVHGLAGTIEHPLVVTEQLHRLGLPVLSLAYRGDRGAPRSPDGLNHLGDTEWRDVDAAIRFAVANGATRVILYGWSTGATMALFAAARSALRDRIGGLILDSPVLGREETVQALASARHVPRAFLPLAVRAAEGRTGLSDDRLPHIGGPEGLRVPTFLVHGPDDEIAPLGYSLALARSRPDLITLRTVPDAPHAAMWNADPNGYDEALRRFLTPLL
ncbi:alpha/beta hydrolase [Streptomyces sp. NPDC058372]|uniref:alpha/beta hydrolase n=1 Tax=unclassified Streptomyces TaxID=2593676 RepID=UPI00365FF893